MGALASFSFLALFVGFFVLALLLIKPVWTWIVRDLFPRAVEQGLVARSISWATALKIAIVITLLAAFVRG